MPNRVLDNRCEPPQDDEEVRKVAPRNYNEAMKKFALFFGLALMVLIFTSVALSYFVRFQTDAQQKNFLENSEHFTLYSLAPYENPEAQSVSKTLQNNHRFHGYAIIGQAPIDDAKTRHQLLNSLYEGADNDRHLTCFDPHHGIRATRGNQTMDLVICFACSTMKVSGNVANDSIYIDSTQRGTFDHVLQENNIPLGIR